MLFEVYLMFINVFYLTGGRISQCIVACTIIIVLHKVAFQLYWSPPSLLYKIRCNSPKNKRINTKFLPCALDALLNTLVPVVGRFSVATLWNASRLSLY